jgi:hypothetical protein
VKKFFVALLVGGLMLLAVTPASATTRQARTLVRFTHTKSVHVLDQYPLRMVDKLANATCDYIGYSLTSSDALFLMRSFRNKLNWTRYQVKVVVGGIIGIYCPSVISNSS